MKCQQCGKEYPHKKGRFCGYCYPPKPESDYSRLMTVAKQLDRDYESLKVENAELRGINQRLSVDWVKFNDMKACLEFFARLDDEMLAVDIRTVAQKALGI